MGGETIRGRLLMGLGGIAIVVGSVLPWVSLTSMLGVSVSKAGYQGDGIVTGAIGLLLIIAGVIGSTERGMLLGSMGAAGAVTAGAIGAGTILNIGYVTRAVGDSVLASVGPGAYLVLAGAVLGLVGGLSNLVFAAKTDPSSATPVASHPQWTVPVVVAGLAVLGLGIVIAMGASAKSQEDHRLLAEAATLHAANLAAFKKSYEALAPIRDATVKGVKLAELEKLLSKATAASFNTFDPVKDPQGVELANHLKEAEKQYGSARDNWADDAAIQSAFGQALSQVDQARSSLAAYESATPKP